MTVKHSPPEVTHFHGPEQLPGHHLQHLLKGLEEDSVEINMLSEMIEQDTDTAKLIMDEAQRIAEDSHFHHEIRSLKHAAILLGMRRIHAILKSEKEETGLSILKTA